MNKYTIFSLLLTGLTAAGVSAQDLEQAKKAINDEQFDKAKSILKSLIKSKPNDGKNFYYLGDLFLMEQQVDSSKFYFNKGVAAKNKGSLNFIGLGQLALDNNNAKEAKTNFQKAEKEIKKKDNDELLLIAKANLNSSNPNAAEAIAYANKALANDFKNAEAYLVLGDAHMLNKSFSEAFSAYREAYGYDPTMLKAKLQLSVITKRAKAYKDAVDGFQEIIKIDPKYAPAYRELAETYKLWANNSNSSKSDEYLGLALANYKKYMELSEGSMESQLRYADFLVLTKNYTELERVASEMKAKENVNPRILRYLGYSSYENGHYAESVEALKSFLTKTDPKNIIGRDYFYLGLSKMAVARNADFSIKDQSLYNEGILDLEKGAQVEPAIAFEYNAPALKLFKDKQYAQAADILNVSAKVQSQDNYMYDNYYLGYSYYILGKDAPEVALLQQSNDAFAKMIAVSPATKEAYLYKARANRYIDTPESREVMTTDYLGYVKAIQDKNELGKAENKETLIEAYTHIGAHYANIDSKDKAIEYLNKVVQLDPSNDFAKSTIKALK
ncbi:tetratricopeptide repeat protein [Flavobacterium sp. JP2137]|uniref:tetratricopeptide repeat protein n=1 Tax=Flavobacterium sp. JP2137 TaxID=3414510 RepID=UPI003D2FFCDC